MTEKEQRDKFRNGRPVFSDEEKMVNTIKGMNGLPDSSSEVFLKKNLQNEDTSYEVFENAFAKKMHPSASAFFPRGVEI